MANIILGKQFQYFPIVTNFSEILMKIRNSFMKMHPQISLQNGGLLVQREMGQNICIVEITLQNQVLKIQ